MRAGSPYELVREMAELGLMGIPLPEEHGGAGGDTVVYALAIEELTRVDSSVAITVAAHTSLGTMPICSSARRSRRRAGCPTSPPAARLAAFGLTEPGAGSDAGAARTTAELRDGDVGRERLEDLHHERRYRAHLGRDDHRPDGRGRDLEHRRRERDARLRDLGAAEQDRLEGIRHPRADVHRLRGPEGNLLGRARQGLPPVPRDPRRRPHLGRGDGRRPRAGRLRPGHAYAKERGSSASRSRSSRPSQFKLADMATEIEAGRALVYRAAWLKDQGRPFALEAAMAKLFTGELSNRAVNWHCRSTAGTGTSTSSRSRASIATRRSSRSAREPTRCSAW